VLLAQYAFVDTFALTGKRKHMILQYRPVDWFNIGNNYNERRVTQ
jgi:hypothetical protein